MKYETLIIDYIQIQRASPEVTIFEVLKQANKEQTWGLLLAYFLDRQTDEILSNVIVNSLLASCGLAPTEETVCLVERPSITQNGKLVDIVIETEKFRISVELKLFAGLYNDFNEYARDNNSKSVLANKQSVLILLCMSTENIINLSGYIPVTWSTFRESLVKNGSALVIRSGSRKIFLFQEFLAMIKNFSEKRKLDQDFGDFYLKYKEKLRSLFRDLALLRGVFSDKSALFALEISKPVYNSETPFLQYKESNEIFAISYCDIKTVGNTIFRLDVVFDLEGTRVEIRTADEAEMLPYLPLFVQANISLSPIPDGRFLWKQKYEPDAEISLIAVEVVEFIRIIRNIETFQMR